MTYGEQMKKILDKFNIDTSTLPDNLYSTLLEAIYNVDVAQDVEFIEGTDFTGTSTIPGVTKSISKINIPYGTTSIGNYAFFSCTSLISITTPDSVTSIGEWAFSDCLSLESVTIGNGVTSIGIQAFSSCKYLANIYYKGTKEQWNAITKGNGWNNSMGSNVSGGTVIHYNS